MIELKEKWALVTGASRGIGSEIARALASRGCNLVLHSRRTENTAPLVEELAAGDGQIVSVAAELSDPDQVERLLGELESVAPQIDILYNNAAVMTSYHNDVWAVASEDFRKSFEVNVISLVRLCNKLVPPMIERGWGRVVNLSSGICQEPQLAPYAMSKASLKQFVLDLVPLLQGSGVAMNLLDPGWLRTDLGGQSAPNAVASVMPGVLVPVLLSHCVSGKEFKAQDYAGMGIEQALDKAELAFAG